MSGNLTKVPNEAGYYLCRGFTMVFSKLSGINVLKDVYDNYKNSS